MRVLLAVLLFAAVVAKAQDKWNTVDPGGTVPALYGARGDCMGDRFIVFGGKDDTDAVNGNLYRWRTDSSQGWELLNPTGDNQAFPTGSYFQTQAHDIFTAGQDTYGDIYVFSGQDAAGDAINSFWFWEMRNGDDGTWTDLAGASGTFPPDMVGASAAQWDDHIYIFGGILDTGSAATEVFWVYDQGSNAWEGNPSQGATPPARAYHSSYAYQDTLYIFGGELEGGALTDELWTLSLKSSGDWTWELADQGNNWPAARRDATMTEYKGYLWVFGGQDGTGAALNELWYVSTYDLKWKDATKASAPTLVGHTACTHSKEMLVFGGSGTVDGTPDNQVYEYEYPEVDNAQPPADFTPSSAAIAAPVVAVAAVATAAVVLA